MTASATMTTRLVTAATGLLVLATLPAGSPGLELVSTSDSPALVQRHEEVTLSCEVDAPWQWCYWHNEHTATRFSTSFDTDDLHTNDSRVVFMKSDYSCGLSISELSEELDPGVWKCHLANTDNADESQMIAEGYLEVQLITKAAIYLETSLSSTGEVGLGSTLSLECQVRAPDLPYDQVLPKPKISLMQEFHVGEDPLNLAESHDNDVITFEKLVELDDENTTFYCQSLQEFDDGQLFYANFSYSTPPLQVSFSPALASEASNDTAALNYFQVEPYSTVELTFDFIVRPMPANGDLQWTVYQGEDSFSLTAGSTVGNAHASAIFPLQEPDSYRNSLSLTNVTSNHTVFVSLQTSQGDLESEYEVVILIPTDESQVEGGVEAAGVSLTIIIPVIIASLLLLIVILVFACYFTVKSKKKTSKSQIKKSRSKQAVDLDKIPDGDLPLMGQEMAAMTGGQAVDLHRSGSGHGGQTSPNLPYTLEPDSVPASGKEPLCNKETAQSLGLGASVTVADQIQPGTDMSLTPMSSRQESPYKQRAPNLLPEQNLSPLVTNPPVVLRDAPGPVPEEHQARSSSRGPSRSASRSATPTASRKKVHMDFHHNGYPTPGAGPLQAPPDARFIDDEIEMRRSADINSPVFVGGAGGAEDVPPAAGTEPLVRLSGPTGYPIMTKKN